MHMNINIEHELIYKHLLDIQTSFSLHVKKLL